MTEKEITVPPFSELESNPEALTIATAPLKIPNCEFIDAVFHGIPRNAFAAVCSKPGNPEEGGWLALKVTSQLAHLCDENNNYLNCSSFYHTEDGNLFNVRKEQFAACHFLMLDDIGTKVPLERFAGFEFSWLVETSPGNHQAGIILTDPITNSLEAEVLLKALISAELWWMGIPIGLLAGTAGFLQRTPALMRRALLWSLPLIVGFTLAFALGGLAYGFLQTRELDLTAYAGWHIPDGLDQPRRYLCAGYMHNAAYLGGALSIPLAWVFHGVVRWRSRVR